jgi:hypothetical protein
MLDRDPAADPGLLVPGPQDRQPGGGQDGQRDGDRGEGAGGDVDYR